MCMMKVSVLNLSLHLSVVNSVALGSVFGLSKSLAVVVRRELIGQSNNMRIN